MTSGTTAERWGARRRRNSTGMVILVAAVALASCGSDDASEAVNDAAADTTAPTTAPTTTAEPTGAPTTAAVAESTAPTPEATAAPAGVKETPDCLVGSWVIDGPAWVANASAALGESMRHVSGRYVYDFADDGTYTVSVEAFTIEIDGEEGPVQVESVGTEEGRWNNSVLTTNEIAIISGLDAADVEDLPHLYVESTAVNVSETGFVRNTRVELGAVDQDQGIEGLGPVDCSSNTLLIRAIAPVAIDVPFSRL